MANTAVESDSLPAPVGWAAVGVLVAFIAAGVVRSFGDRPALTLVAAAVAVVAGAIALLDLHRWSFLPAAAVSAVAIGVLGNGTASNVCWFAVCLLAGWAALTQPLPVAATCWAAATVGLIGERLFTTDDAGWFAWIAGTGFSVIGCLFGRRQHDLVVELREAQAGLAQRAQLAERNRIARELHDVIAHSLTVSLLHVSSARLALRDDPADAERALAEAERLGRASLDEVRHAVGTLHPDGAADPTQPLPGSTDVPALLAGFRSAGADLDVVIDGDLTTLPATVGLATYRILQEAITNACRHAPGKSITGHVAVTADAVRLVIDNSDVRDSDVRDSDVRDSVVDGSGTPGRGAGLGLLSMRERAASLGGTCSAGPGGPGWSVHAELPLVSAHA